MCGIVGFWSKSINPTDARQLVRAATLAISHRGPDAAGYWHDQSHGVYLGHRRLSIIDLSEAANQPMLSPSGNSVIIFNGEIYNYIELQKTISAHGINLKTDSDTEVILAVYEIFGVEGFDKLRGMFSFAVWDKLNKKLILARDRIGKKPLYYLESNDGIFFASEVHALLALIPKSEVVISEASVINFLKWGASTGGSSIYKNIRKIIPATVSEYKNFRLCKSFTYASSPLETPIIKRSFRDTVSELDNIISESVSLRLRSDVPIGIFLSGGIDSSLITAIATKKKGVPISTFSIGSESPQLDESLAAREISKFLNTNHHELILSSSIMHRIPQIIEAYSEPIADPSIIPTFLLSEFTSPHCKVVLNGDGGDECFGGYRRHIAAFYIEKLHKILPPLITTSLSKILLAALPCPKTHRSFFEFFHRLISTLALPEDQKLLSLSTDGFTDTVLGELGLQLDIGAHKECVGSLFENIRAIDYNLGLPDVLLPKIDISTMHFGLEGRSPLLDQEVITFGFSIDCSLLFYNGKTKSPLRALAEKYLPESITKLPKKGFEVPIYEWIDRGLLANLTETIADDPLISSILNRQSVLKLIKKELDWKYGTHRRRKMVWILFCLASWNQTRIKVYNNHNNSSSQPYVTSELL